MPRGCCWCSLRQDKGNECVLHPHTEHKHNIVKRHVGLEGSARVVSVRADTTMMVLRESLDAHAVSVDATEHIRFTGAVPLAHGGRRSLPLDETALTPGGRHDHTHGASLS